MGDFRLSFEDLSKVFSRYDIPSTDPGFCDHPAFLKLETRNPELLNLYAAFVAKKTYSADYLSWARGVITRSATALHAELVRNGRQGACVDVSGILSRILDREGVWNVGVKGSLTIQFPKESGLETQYFWSSDEGNFVAGHAWLLAPPFTVVDISVRQQPYKSAMKHYLPEMVLSEESRRVDVFVEDIVSPSVRQAMLRCGIPKEHHLTACARYVPGIFEAIPPVLVPAMDGTILKYSPVAIHAPDKPLEEMENMDFGGLTPWELYTRKLRSAIHSEG